MTRKQTQENTNDDNSTDTKILSNKYSVCRALESKEAVSVLNKDGLCAAEELVLDDETERIRNEAAKQIAIHDRSVNLGYNMTVNLRIGCANKCPHPQLQIWETNKFEDARSILVYKDPDVTDIWAVTKDDVVSLVSEYAKYNFNKYLDDDLSYIHMKFYRNTSDFDFPKFNIHLTSYLPELPEFEFDP